MIGITEKLNQLIHDYPLPTVDLKKLELYLEHAEWSLVFDEFCAICQEEGLVLTVADWEWLAALGTYLEEDKTLWERIRRM